jgi:hypothetical protein
MRQFIEYLAANEDTHAPAAMAARERLSEVYLNLQEKYSDESDDGVRITFVFSILVGFAICMNEILAQTGAEIDSNPEAPDGAGDETRHNFAKALAGAIEEGPIGISRAVSMMEMIEDIEEEIEVAEAMIDRPEDGELN